MAKHVAVLMGGLSAEREVSLRSGAACAQALRGQGFEVTEIDVGTDVAPRLTALAPDVAFNALHGRFGEDGAVQGLLELLRIPYTHSGVLASALAMAKDRARVVMAAAGLPVAKGFKVSRTDAAKAHVMAPPYVLKPLAEGSSFGVLIVAADHAHPPQELTRADWAYGEDLLAEQFIAGRELTCGVMGDRPLDVIDIRAADGGWYDYNAKYAAGGSITSFRQNLKEIFTNRSNTWLSRHTEPSGVAA